MVRLAAVAAGILCIASTPIDFTDYAADFDRIEAQTRGMPSTQRVIAFRMAFERIRPGLYVDKDPQALDRRIAKALADFPDIRDKYLAVERAFPATLNAAIARFHSVFPNFESPLPIILAHELGVRDGGSDYVGGQKVMLFGADMIATLHDDDSLQPFLEHELFHLEHARHFADCDQLWCPLWQEGLATDAARLMTPHASDHQLLLDVPDLIRPSTDRAWTAALCFFSVNFDQTDPKLIDEAFSGNQHPPELPPRFGYYVGLRISELAERTISLDKLARLDDVAARAVVVKALTALMLNDQASCRKPVGAAPITHRAPRPA